MYLSQGWSYWGMGGTDWLTGGSCLEILSGLTGLEISSLTAFWGATWVFFSAFSFLVTCATLAFPSPRAEQRLDRLLNANTPHSQSTLTPLSCCTKFNTPSTHSPSHNECQGEMMLDKLRVFFKVHFATAFRKTYLVETPVRIRSSIDEISSARWLIVFHLRKETPSVLCLIFQELVCQFSVCSGLALFDKKARPE